MLLLQLSQPAACSHVQNPLALSKISCAHAGLSPSRSAFNRRLITDFVQSHLKGLLVLELTFQLWVQVIGLQSTGEANSNAVREASGNEADDLISAPRVAMQQFIERQFPYASDLDASELSTLEYQVRSKQ